MLQPWVRHCENSEYSTRCMAVYSGGSDLAKRIRKQCFDKDEKPLRPHQLSDTWKRLHAPLGCHSLHSILIGFYYAKWSEKLLFHLANNLANAYKPERSHSRTSSSRSRTPSPKMAPASTRSAGDPSRSPNLPERHSKSPKIASSSAAGRDMSMEEAEENLNDLRVKTAAIFDETKDGLLTKKDKAVFWYRQGRRQEWQAVASEIMMNESEWNDQHDQEALKELRKAEEQLETLLEEHKKSIGYGPAGQGSN
jgi:hypothetical protein